LLRIARKSGIIPGWESEHSRKSPVWEQVHLPVLEYSGMGGSRISWKIPAWEQVHLTSLQKSPENSGLAKDFIQPTEVNHIPGQEKFDH
jgi:hypothetical protein